MCLKISWISCLCLFISLFAVGKTLPVRFIVNGDTISDAKYYLIINNKGQLLPISNNRITIPDTLTAGPEILLVYKSYHVFISPPKDALFLEINSNNKLFNNSVRRETKSGLFKSKYWFKKGFKLKYLFKRMYLIKYGLSLETTTFQSKKNYAERYGIAPFK